MIRTRLAAVLGVLVLAPITAEYLSGYDSSTGDPQELLGGLLIFAGLYGAPALLIRELSVRAQVGWRARLCWGATFGVVEAGLIDHSMFSPNYREISYWQDLVGPTWIPGLEFGFSAAFSFVVGHMIFSIAIPLVVVEAIHPSVRERTWLGPVGLVIAALGYLGASALVVWWHLQTESFRPSVGQLIGAGVVALALVLLGLLVGRRPASRVSGRTPSPWLFGLGAVVATFLFDLNTSWAGTLLAVAILVGTLVALFRFSRTAGWSQRHLVLVVGGALLCRAVQGYWVDPIGDGSLAAQYAHNTVAVLLVLTLVAIGWRRNGESLDSQHSTPRHAAGQPAEAVEREEIREPRNS